MRKLKWCSETMHGQGWRGGKKNKKNDKNKGKEKENEIEEVKEVLIPKELYDRLVAQFG